MPQAATPSSRTVISPLEAACTLNATVSEERLIIPLARAVAVLFVASVVPSSTEAVAMLVPDSWGIYGMYVLMIAMSSSRLFALRYSPLLHCVTGLL